MREHKSKNQAKFAQQNFMNAPSDQFNQLNTTAPINFKQLNISGQQTAKHKNAKEFNMTYLLKNNKAQSRKDPSRRIASNIYSPNGVRKDHWGRQSSLNSMTNKSMPISPSRQSNRQNDYSNKSSKYKRSGKHIQGNTRKSLKIRKGYHSKQSKRTKINNYLSNTHSKKKYQL